MNEYAKKIVLPTGIVIIIVAAIVLALALQGNQYQLSTQTPAKTVTDASVQGGGMMGGGGAKQPSPSGPITGPASTPTPGQNQVKSVWTRDELTADIKTATSTEEAFSRMTTIYNDGIIIVKGWFPRDDGGGTMIAKNIGKKPVSVKIEIEELDLSPALQDAYPEGLKYNSGFVGLKPGIAGTIGGTLSYMSYADAKKFQIRVQYT